MGEDRFDGLARTLAKPMPRRKALRMLAAGLVGAAVPGMTTGRARAAAQSPPCSGGGTFCGNVNPLGEIGYNVGCCLGAEGETRTVCCPGIPGVVGSLCCPTGYTCGNTHAGSTENCKCSSGVVCDGKCCKRGEYCQTQLLGDDFCEKLCPHTRSEKCNGVCCTENETCGFFGCGCKSGFVSAGAGTCVLPREDPGDPKPGPNPFRNMLNMMGLTSSAHGGSRHAGFARPAQSGSAALDAALDALAAVNGQGAAAMLAIRGGKRDPAFKQKVTVARAAPPTLSAGAGLDASSAAALNRLLIAEARAHALIAAMAKALWRARAAHAKRDRPAAKRQLRASATFAGQAVTALKRVQVLRTGAANALTAGGVSEVHAFDNSVAAFVASVQARGIPASLSTPMGRLGVGGADLKRLRAGVLDQSMTATVGPVLIAPLQSPERASQLKSLISELSKFSRRARKHPIAR
jgi:hypothetical protein